MSLLTLDDVLETAAAAGEPVTAGAIAERFRDHGLLGPAQDGNAIGIHLADLRELGLLRSDSSKPRRWSLTGRGRAMVARIVTARSIAA